MLTEKGVPKMFRLGATEKVYGDYQLSVTNKGGHSSEPRADNAIYELAQALLTISKFHFPFELNNVTRAYFERLAEQSPPAARGGHARAYVKTPPDPRRSSGSRSSRRTTPSCAPIAWPRGLTAATPTTRCRSAPRRTSTVAFCRVTLRRRSVSS